jgi:hypothetical protein
MSIRAAGSERSSPLDNSDQHYDNCDDQQDMNESTDRMPADQPQKPPNHENHKDCPQHGIPPFYCPVFLRGKGLLFQYLVL